MKSNLNILFTATFNTTFIKNDLLFLQKNFQVVIVIKSGYGALISFLNKIKKTDITFSWFASVYSGILILLVKVFNKKSILILGGVDVAKEKEFNYGIWNSWWKSFIVKYAITNADRVLAVDQSIKSSAVNLCKYDGKNISVVPTGYDSSFWKSKNNKHDLVLTVASCPDMIRIKIKGIDYLIEVAKITPNINFIIIGIDDSLLPKLYLPKNVKVLPLLSQQELLKHYQTANVYFQPSYKEGLPNSLCEAMLCECFPIGTRIGGIPNAIGEAGIIVEYGNTIEASNAISKAIKRTECKEARERIINLFDKEIREKKLIEIINSLYSE